MQSVGLVFWKIKSDDFRSFGHSSLATASILCVMIAIILPALASEAFATDPAGRTSNGRATAVASAQVIKPFTLKPIIQAGNGTSESAITVLRRTTLRSCAALLGNDDRQAATGTCELRLTELQ